MRKRLEEMEARFERWAEALTAGAMTIEQFRGHNERLLWEEVVVVVALAEAEGRLEAQSEHERLLGEVQKALQDLPAMWEQLQPEERKEILRLVVEDLEVARQADGSKVARMRLRHGPADEGAVG